MHLWHTEIAVRACSRGKEPTISATLERTEIYELSELEINECTCQQV